MDEQLLKIIDEAEWKRVQSMLSKDLTTLAEQAEKVVIKFDVDATNKQLKDGINIINQYNQTLVNMTKAEEVHKAALQDKINLQQKEISLSGQLQNAQSAEATNVAALSAAKKEASRITALQVQLQTNEAGSVNYLKAAIALNAIELDKHTAAEIKNSSELSKLQAQTEEYSNQLKLSKALQGDMRANVGNYSSALTDLEGTTKRYGKTQNNTYYSTFAFTQLLRDAPNFAISTRIGLMAISNNLPMVKDGLDSIAHSMIMVKNAAGEMVERQAGYGYALKTLGKSLLSVNTLLILLQATALLFTNDKFISWISGISEASSKTKKALQDVNGEMGKAYSSIIKITATADAASKGYISQKDAVEQYNTSLGGALGKVSTFKEMLGKLKGTSTDYINAMAMMTYANSLYQEAVEHATKAEALRMDKTVTWYQNAWNWIKNIFTEDKTVRERRNIAASKESDKAKNDIKSYITEFDKASKYMKSHGINMFGDDKGKEKFTQTAKEITITEEFYDKKRADIVEHMSELELQSAKTTNEGVLNSYDNRRQAADEYYSTLKALADSDLKTATDTAIKKAENQTDEVNKAKADNLKKLNNQKITNAEYEKADKKLNDDLKIIESNKNIAIEKANAEHYKTIQDGERKHVATLTAIDKDVYEDQLYNLKISNEQRLELLNEYEKQRTDQLNRNTMSDAFLKQLGYEKDSEMDLLNFEKEINEKRLANNLQYIEAQLALTKAGTEEYKNLIRQRNEAVQAFSDERAEYEIKVENYITQKINEYQEKIAEGTKTAINNLWESYWTVQSDNIDKQKDKYQKAEDEKLNVLEKAHDAGTLLDKAYNKQKEKIEEKYQKKQDALEAKDKKNKREALLLEQGVALAKVWINYFSTRMTYEAAQAGLIAALSTNPITAVGAVPAALAVYEPLKALLLKTAIVDSAGVAAQAIPYFNEGGIMEKTGMAMVGDNMLWGGKRERELLIPPSGEMSLTPDFPTLMKLEKGTHIIPDVEHIPSIDDIQRKIIVNSIFKSEKIEEKLDMIYNKIGNNKLSLMDKMMIKRYGKLS